MGQTRALPRPRAAHSRQQQRGERDPPLRGGRINWLFSGNGNGTGAEAEASCRVFALIETAKRNGKESYAYLLAVLPRLPEVRRSGDWKRLLTWKLDDQGTGEN